jgi:hypothetical protein
LKPLRFLMRERRDAAATRGALLLGESFGHVRGLRSGSTILGEVLFQFIHCTPLILL